MAKSASKQKKSFLKRLQATLSNLEQCEDVNIDQAYRLPDKKVRLALENYPLQINVGPDNQTLHLYPEVPVDGNPVDTENNSYILFDPESYYSGISGFCRLKDGDKITLSRSNDYQRAYLNTSKNILDRQLTISNNEGQLFFKSHDSKSGNCIAPLLKNKKINQVVAWRQKKLQRIRKIIGDPLQNLSQKEALSLIREVNSLLENEVHRPKDKQGRPGGVIAIPDSMAVFIVGDLHTKLDNLLTILSQNNFLEALEEGNTSLIILGDAVHPEEDGEYDKMESSMVMMDVIFKLKLHFPEQVFYIRGNHDSFSEEIAKRGVPQGLLWETQLIKSRGKQYRNEMQRFYDLLPYLAYSKYFITCHASPPTVSTNLQELVNIRDYPKLRADLTNKRLQTPSRMSGYCQSDIKKLRKYLKVSADTPLIVGHTPMSPDDTIWEKVGDIEQHFIVYCGDSDWVGVMAQIGEKMYPLRYPAEPLAAIISSIPD